MSNLFKIEIKYYKLLFKNIIDPKSEDSQGKNVLLSIENDIIIITYNINKNIIIILK